PRRVRHGSLGCGRAVIALAPLHLLQDDAVEEHGQLGGTDLQAGWPVTGRGGGGQDGGFEGRDPQGTTRLLPGDGVEAGGGAVAENEPVAGERVITEGLADEGAEAVEGFAEIGGLSAEEATDARTEAQHEGSSKVARRAWRVAGSKPGGMRRQRP